MKDPGLQPERTVLSWRRTCLALCVLSIYVMRSGWAYNDWFGISMGASTLAAAAWVAWLSYRRELAILKDPSPPRTIPWVIPAAVSSLISCLGVTGLALTSR